MLKFIPVPGRIVFLDTEFTTLDKRRREVWEIAAIIRDPGGAPDVEVEWQIRPDLTDASPDSLRIGRYYERNRVQDQPVGAAVMTYHPELGEISDVGVDDMAYRVGTAETVAAALAPMLSGAYLVGAVVSADETALDPFMTRYGQSLAHHYRLRCVETLALGYLHGLRAERATVPGREESHETLVAEIPAPPWSTATLSRLCGVEPPSKEKAHRALVDARWARDLWDAVHAGRRPTV